MSRYIDADALIEKWEQTKGLPLIFGDIIADAIIDAVKDAPTIEPERSTGKWVRVSADEYVTRASYVYRCNVCGGKSWYDSKYCPVCGSLMERNT